MAKDTPMKVTNAVGQWPQCGHHQGHGVTEILSPRLMPNRQQLLRCSSMGKSWEQLQKLNFNETLKQPSPQVLQLVDSAAAMIALQTIYPPRSRWTPLDEGQMSSPESGEHFKTQRITQLNLWTGRSLTLGVVCALSGRTE